MRWKEILIGAGIYLLVILSGYGVPILAHLVKSHTRTLITLGREENTAWHDAIRLFQRTTF